MKSNTPELEKLNYSLSFLKRPKYILLLVIMFFVVIFINFPIAKKIDSLIFGALSSNPSCPINMDAYEINVFPLPHLKINDLSVPNRCLAGGPGNLVIPELKAYFRGPSLFPLGVSFKIETEINKNPIEALATLGSNNYIFSLSDNKISLDKLGAFIPQVQLAGDIFTAAHVEIENGVLSVLNLKLQSKNFTIPSQEIQGFIIQSMNIKNLFLTAVTEKNTLNINQFILGDESSPLRSEFKGKIIMNKKNLKASTLNLSGQVAIIEKMLEENFILKSYLSQFDKKDNFYQIQISGPLMRPSVKSKR